MLMPITTNPLSSLQIMSSLLYFAAELPADFTVNESRAQRYGSKIQ